MKNSNTNNETKVKALLFKFKMKGFGIVNYDDKGQKQLLNKLKIYHLTDRYNNSNYAKKLFYKDSSIDETQYKIIISSECLKHSMFNDEFVSENNSSAYHPEIQMSILSSPSKIVKGYFFGKNGENGIARKSCLTITSAVQTNNSMSHMEFHIRSGEKGVFKMEEKSEQNNPKDDVPDNTIFNKETIGEITYEGKGSIGIADLEFVSMDDIFGRTHLNESDFELYKKYLNLHMVNFEPTVGYYRFSEFDITPERGFKFSIENKNFLVNYLLNKILNINIRRSGAYAQITELKIKPVYDFFNDTYESEEGWMTINRQMVNSLNFDYAEFYTLMDEKASVSLRDELKINTKKEKDIKENIKKTTREKKEEKAAKKEQSN